MNTQRKQLIDFIEQGAVATDKIDGALTVLQITPDGKRWQTFIDHLLLWLGGLAMAFALMFFIAYNWKDLGHFAKFAMVEGVIVLAIGAYCKLADNHIAGKVTLLVATICLGVLLALYGQTYQTGADPWQLFFNWALLMVPWAIIGRFAAIWIVWIALVNVAIVLYYMTFRGIFGFVFSSDAGMLWLAFAFNTAAFVTWQMLAPLWDWLAERWAIRLLALGSGVSLTWLVIISMLGFDFYPVGGYPGLVWVVWLAAMFYVYRQVTLDLFLLAGCCLSAITVIVTFIGKHLLPHGEAGAFLFLAFSVIAMGSVAALWLKHVHQEHSHE